MQSYQTLSANYRHNNISSMQLSKIITTHGSDGSIRPIFSEEECWDFFADNMASFTSPSMASTPREPKESALQDETVKVLVKEFFHSLGVTLQSVPTYRVCIISSYTNLH